MSDAFDWMPKAQWMVADEPGFQPLRFLVAGVPVAQGSKRHVGKGIMIESSKQLQPWREAVIDAAQRAAGGHSFFAGVALDLSFRFPRPKAHYGTGRNQGKLKSTVPLLKVTAPDLDKLCRAVLDALTQSGVLRDDALVASLYAEKRYDPRPGAEVVIRHV